MVRLVPLPSRVGERLQVLVARLGQPIAGTWFRVDAADTEIDRDLPARRAIELSGLDPYSDNR